MAAIRNYTVERGIQFARQVTLKTGGVAVDLAGATFLGKIRLSSFPTDIRSFAVGDGPLVTEFDCALVGLPALGTFSFALTVAKTLLLSRAVYDYDIVITFTNGDKRRIIRGRLAAVEVVSRA